MRRYIILNPTFDQTDEILKRYIRIYNKKYEKKSVCCVIKQLTTTTRVRYIRINTKFILDNFFKFCNYSILSRINQDGYYFSHIYETRITFSSSFRDMTYYYYLKQPMSKCENRFNQILDKTQKFIDLINRYSIYPFNRKDKNLEIIFVNESIWESLSSLWYINEQ